MIKSTQYNFTMATKFIPSTSVIAVTKVMTIITATKAITKRSTLEISHICSLLCKILSNC